MSRGTYSVILARPRDLVCVPRIELAAARMLVGYAPSFVLAETTSHEALTDAQRRGHLWVAVCDDVPVGFAHVTVRESAVAHLEEVDVDPTHGRRGLGTWLVTTVIEWAASAGFASLTLTTFSDVPWNRPFYSRLGFEVLPATALSPVLLAVVDDERRRGLDPVRRVVMQRRLETSSSPVSDRQSR